MEFWERLNALIKERKVTQEWVAAQSNIKYQTFRNWSARHIIPDAVQTVAIAKALHTTVEYLVTGDDSNPFKHELDSLKSELKELSDKYL